MGFIMRQFLEGEPERYRRYKPARVAISGESVPHINDSPFGIRNYWVENAAFYIQAVKRPGQYQKSGDYQELFLTKDEVDKILPEMIEAGEQSTRLKIALAVLSGLTDGKLSQFMSNLQSKRAKTTPANRARELPPESNQ